MSSSASITFRTLGGAHTINKLSNETDEQAIGRQLNEHPHRIKIEMLDGSPFVVVLELEHPIVVQRERDAVERERELERQRERERELEHQRERERELERQRERERELERQRERERELEQREHIQYVVRRFKEAEFKGRRRQYGSVDFVIAKRLLADAVRLQMPEEARMLRTVYEIYLNSR
jgi:hypothetical protein